MPSRADKRETEKRAAERRRLAGLGVGPRQMAKAVMYLRQGKSLEVAARLALATQRQDR